MGSGGNDLDFYSAVAQIVPVIFIVFAFELRSYRARISDESLALFGLALLLIGCGGLLIAEVAALATLDAGKASDLNHSLVVQGLSGATALIVLEVVLSRVYDSVLYERYPRRMSFLVLAWLAFIYASCVRSAGGL